MVADVVVSAAKSFPDPTTLALVSDVQFREPYSSGALNRKFRGIVNPGIYGGFTPSPAGGLTLQITSDSEGGTASINIDKYYQLTVRQQAGVSLSLTAGKTSIVVLEATYVVGQETYQVNANSAIQAAEIKLLEEGALLNENQLELCTVKIPAGATEITDDMIDVTNRKLVTLGISLSNDYESDAEDVAITPKGVKEGLEKKQPLDTTLSELAGKTVAELLEYLRLGEGAPAIGIPFFWPSSVMPNAVIKEWADMVFLKFNGATFSASTYPKLALVIPSLMLVDARGEFPRIWDDGRGVDSGRALLSTQSDGTKTQTGTLWARQFKIFGDTGFLSAAVQNPSGVFSIDNNAATTGWDYIENSRSGVASGANRINLNIGNAAETRPRNITFNFLVRAK